MIFVKFLIFVSIFIGTTGRQFFNEYHVESHFNVTCIPDMYTAVIGIFYKLLKIYRHHFIKIRRFLSNFYCRSNVKVIVHNPLVYISIASSALFVNVCFYLITLGFIIIQSNDIELNPGPPFPVIAYSVKSTSPLPHRHIHAIPPLFNLTNTQSPALYTNIYFYLTSINIILKISNDIEINPGPEIPNPLSLIHLNVCSLRNKITILESEIADKCDILCLTETRIDRDFSDEDILIPGYSKPLFRKDNTRNSGGICVQLSDQLHAVRLGEYEDNNLELLWLRVSIGRQAFILGVGYRNPELPVEYWDRLDNNVSAVVDVFGSQNLVLVGDFNHDLMNKRKHHFRDIINSYNLSQLITEPTRITGHSRTLLDPIIVGNVSYVKSSGVLPPFCSDHSPVFVELDYKLPKYQSFKRRIYNYDRANWDMMGNEIDSINWTEILNTNNVDDSADILTLNLTRIINRFIPNRVTKFSNRDKPWVTQKIKFEIRKRNKMYQKVRRTGSVEHWTAFKRQRNYVTGLIRIAKTSHVQEMVGKMEQHKSSEKIWWKLVKCITNVNHKESSIPCLKMNNSITINSPLGKAKMFNDYFASICSVDDSHIPLQPDDVIIENKLSTFETNAEEVYEELKKLDISKAVGPDLISPIVLKQLAASLCHPLAHLYNKEVRERKHALIWKISNVAPIFKKDDPHEVSNYRPISLLSILGKVMEKLVFKRVFNHISAYITKSQSGFLPRHSTVTQLLEIYHILLEALDKRKEIVVCF